MQYNDIFIFAIIIMFLIGMYIAIMRDNEAISQPDPPVQILTIEHQKDICDSLYSDYIFHFTAYQNAIIYGESKKLINTLQEQYQNDSLQLSKEMQIYFQLKQNEAE